MEKHILSLIKENNRVIIPNFGAFIIAKENGFTILFNNFLSFNDGLLVDHVIEFDKVSKVEANELVDKYVESLKDKLDSEGRYEIDGLGLFTKDSSGILRFSQADDINYVEDPANSENTLLDIDSGSNEDIKEPIEVVSENTEEIDILKETPLVEVEPEPTKEPEPVKKVTIEKVESTTSSSSHSYIEEDNSKRNRSIFIFLILFILIPLIVFSVYFLFFNKKEEVKKSVRTEKVIPKVKAKQPEVKSKQQGGIVAGPETKKEEVTEKPIVPKVVVNTTKPHHLIVGSFKNTNNADKYLVKLRGMGYEDCMGIKSNTMTLISIQSFAKVFEAQAKQEELLEKHKMESWILTKRK